MQVIVEQWNGFVDVRCVKTTHTHTDTNAHTGTRSEVKISSSDHITATLNHFKIIEKNNWHTVKPRTHIHARQKNETFFGGGSPPQKTFYPLHKFFFGGGKTWQFARRFNDFDELSDFWKRNWLFLDFLRKSLENVGFPPPQPKWIKKKFSHVHTHTHTHV